jgi:putative PEP-CTERM system TPR-repeat lipoprotein
MSTIRPRRHLAVASLLASLLVLAGCGGTDPAQSVASAKDYLAKQDYKAAIIHLKDTLQQAPDHAEARMLLGRALLESGDASGAETELRKALDREQPRDQVVPLLARAMYDQGQSDKLLRELGTELLTDATAKADLTTTLGMAELQRRNNDAAASRFEQALTEKPGYARAMLGKARISAAGNKLADAGTLVDLVLSGEPKNADALLLKAQLVAVGGNKDEALAAYRRVVTERPDNVRARAAIVSLLIENARYDEAAAELETMKKAIGDHPQYHHLMGLLLVRQKKFTEAREHLDQVLRVAPNHVPSLLLAGAAEFQLRSFATAEERFSKVLTLAPSSEFARRMLTGVYLQTGRPSRALDTIKPLLDGKGTDDPTLNALAGEVWLANGDYEEAAQYLDKAASADPGNAIARTRLGVSRLAQGDVEQALADLEEASRADKGSIQADLTLIATQLRRNQPDAAMKSIADLEKKRPDDPLVPNLRGAALLVKRDAAGARAQFEQALKMRPTFFPAASNLARLDLAEQKPQDAKRRFEELLKHDDDSIQALLALAGVKSHLGEPQEESKVLIERAIAAAPDAVQPRLALIAMYTRAKLYKQALAAAQQANGAIPNSGPILEGLGIAQMGAGEHNQAIKTFNELATLAPSSPAPHLRMAEAYLALKDTAGTERSLRKALEIQPALMQAQSALIATLMVGGKADEALRYAREVQRDDPKGPAGYAYEGDILTLQRKHADAAGAYKTALAKRGVPTVAVKYHGALMLAKQTTEAQKFEQAWLKQQPKDPVFRSYLGERALATNDFPLAAKHFRSVLEFGPDNPIVLNNLAWALGQMNDPKALEIAEKANRLAPNTPAIEDTLGSVLVATGDTKRGIELLRKAADADAKAHDIRLHLARALIKSGDKGAARVELETLAKLGEKYPRRVEVEKLLRSL